MSACREGLGSWEDFCDATDAVGADAGAGPGLVEGSEAVDFAEGDREGV